MPITSWDAKISGFCLLSQIAFAFTQIYKYKCAFKCLLLAHRVALLAHKTVYITYSFTDSGFILSMPQICMRSERELVFTELTWSYSSVFLLGRKTVEKPPGIWHHVVQTLKVTHKTTLKQWQNLIGIAGSVHMCFSTLYSLISHVQHGGGK